MTVIATVGAAVKIAEMGSKHEKTRRLRQLNADLRRAEEISKLEIESQRINLLKNVIKRQEKKEAEVNRIVYGIPDEVPVPAKKSSWWWFKKSNSNEVLQKTVVLENETELMAQADFRAQHPFAAVKVPSLYMVDFVKEFDWLQSKTGKIPSTADQQAILIGLIRNS